MLQSRGHKRKHPIENPVEPGASQERRGPKRQRLSPTGNTPGELAIDSGTPEPTDPVAYWVEKTRWPKKLNWTKQTDSTMERLRAWRRSSFNSPRKRSSSVISITPSDQSPSEEKSALYRDQCYETLLEYHGSYMTKAREGLASASLDLCRSLLENAQPVPGDTLFRDDIFEKTCEKIRKKNEARVIQDIGRLIVPFSRKSCYIWRKAP